MPTKPVDNLLHALEATKDEQIQLLQALIRAASPNPPGTTTAAARVITDFLTTRRIPHSVIEPQPGQPNVVAEFTGSLGPGPRIIMNGHLDVFPVGDGAGWTRDPWSGDIEGDKIHGRGVVDMKSGTASLVLAFAALYEQRAHLRGSVALCAVSDEETGGKWGTKYLLEQDRARWGGDVVLNAEPVGCGTVRFTEKGTLRATVIVKAPAAHGAYLNLSKGAIRIAGEVIGDVVREVEEMKFELEPELVKVLARPEVKHAVNETMGSGAFEIIAKPTVNIGTIRGGLKVNMIPDTCVFEIDIRMPPGPLAPQVLAIIDTILAKYTRDKVSVELQVQEAASNPYSFSTPKHPLLGLLVKHAEGLSPEGLCPVPIPSMGATDCKHYRYAGIPAYTYGCSPYKMASVDEYASIREFLHVTKVHAAAAFSYLSAEKDTLPEN